MAFNPMIVLLGSLFVLIILRVPVAFALGLSSLLVIMLDPALDPIIVAIKVYEGLYSYILIAIPFFMLAAAIMTAGGLTKKVIDLCYGLVGHIRGGLGHVNVVGSMFFAGITGCSSADVAGIGGVLIPAMESKGYDKEFTVGVTAASSTMGVIIPPSLMMVIYAAVSGVSLGALFMGGFIPGVIIGLSQMVVVDRFAARNKYPREQKTSLMEKLIRFKGAILSLFMPVIIVGGVVGGIVTATEAAVIAALYGIFLTSLVYRTLTFKKLWEVAQATAIMASLSVFCICVSLIFGWLVGYYEVSKGFGVVLAHVSTNKHVIFLLIIGMFLLVGTFMDAAPAMMIFVPIVAPIAYSLGVHPIHLGVLVVMSLALGLITPPYGICLLLASKIGNIEVKQAMPVILIFVSMFLAMLVLLILFEGPVLWLPRLALPESYLTVPH